MRIVPLALALVSASGLGLFAACSVDDAGMEDGSADGGFDVTGDVVGSDAGAMDAPADTYVGPTCQTIDASCLGADIPDGWVLFNVAQDAGGCPGDDEDYEQHDLVTNPQLRSDSCTCAACTTTGAWGCTGNVTVIGGTGGSCGNDASFASGPTCVPLSESTGLGCLFAASTTVSVLEPAPSGSPSKDVLRRLAHRADRLRCRMQTEAMHDRLLRGSRPRLSDVHPAQRRPERRVSDGLVSSVPRTARLPRSGTSLSAAADAVAR